MEGSLETERLQTAVGSVVAIVRWLGAGNSPSLERDEAGASVVQSLEEAIYPEAMPDYVVLPIFLLLPDVPSLKDGGGDESMSACFRSGSRMREAALHALNAAARGIRGFFDDSDRLEGALRRAVVACNDGATRSVAVELLGSLLAGRAGFPAWASGIGGRERARPCEELGMEYLERFRVRLFEVGPLWTAGAVMALSDCVRPSSVARRGLRRAASRALQALPVLVKPPLLAPFLPGVASSLAAAALGPSAGSEASSDAESAAVAFAAWVGGVLPDKWLDSDESRTWFRANDSESKGHILPEQESAIDLLRKLAPSSSSSSSTFSSSPDSRSALAPDDVQFSFPPGFVLNAGFVKHAAAKLSPLVEKMLERFASSKIVTRSLARASLLFAPRFLGLFGEIDLGARAVRALGVSALDGETNVDLLAQVQTHFARQAPLRGLAIRDALRRDLASQLLLRAPDFREVMALLRLVSLESGEGLEEELTVSATQCLRLAARELEESVRPPLTGGIPLLATIRGATHVLQEEEEEEAKEGEVGLLVGTGATEAWELAATLGGVLEEDGEALVRWCLLEAQRLARRGEEDSAAAAGARARIGMASPMAAERAVLAYTRAQGWVLAATAVLDGKRRRIRSLPCPGSDRTGTWGREVDEDGVDVRDVAMLALEHLVVAPVWKDHSVVVGEEGEERERVQLSSTSRFGFARSAIVKQVSRPLNREAGALFRLTEEGIPVDPGYFLPRSAKEGRAVGSLRMAVARCVERLASWSGPSVAMLLPRALWPLVQGLASPSPSTAAATERALSAFAAATRASHPPPKLPVPPSAVAPESSASSLLRSRLDLISAALRPRLGALGRAESLVSRGQDSILMGPAEALALPEVALLVLARLGPKPPLSPLLAMAAAATQALAARRHAHLGAQSTLAKLSAALAHTAAPSLLRVLDAIAGNLASYSPPPKDSSPPIPTDPAFPWGSDDIGVASFALHRYQRRAPDNSVSELPRMPRRARRALLAMMDRAKHHFMGPPDEVRAALNLVVTCSTALQFYPGALYPTLHRLWPALVSVCSHRTLAEHAQLCVAQLIDISGDFLGAKAAESLWPTIAHGTTLASLQLLLRLVRPSLPRAPRGRGAPDADPDARGDRRVDEPSPDAGKSGTGAIQRSTALQRPVGTRLSVAADPTELCSKHTDEDSGEDELDGDGAERWWNAPPAEVLGFDVCLVAAQHLTRVIPQTAAPDTDADAERVALASQVIETVAAVVDPGAAWGAALALSNDVVLSPPEHVTRTDSSSTLLDSALSAMEFCEWTTKNVPGALSSTRPELIDEGGAALAAQEKATTPSSPSTLLLGAAITGGARLRPHKHDAPARAGAAAMRRSLRDDVFRRPDPRARAALALANAARGQSDEWETQRSIAEATRPAPRLARTAARTARTLSKQQDSKTLQSQLHTALSRAGFHQKT